MKITTVSFELFCTIYLDFSSVPAMRNVTVAVKVYSIYTKDFFIVHFVCMCVLLYEFTFRPTCGFLHVMFPSGVIITDNITHCPSLSFKQICTIVILPLAK